MQDCFVSLQKVVDTVAARVELSDEELENFIEAPVSDDKFSRMLARAPAKSAFKSARAAAALLKALFGRGRSVIWYELSRAGFPLLSDKVSVEAKSILLIWAKGEEQFKAWVRAGCPQSEQIDSGIGAFTGLPGRPRTQLIGFSLRQIIDVLGRNNIPHNLHAEQTAFANTGLVGTVQRSICHLSGESSGSGEAPDPPGLRNFRGPMAGPLRRAVKEAKNPDDWYSVWEALVRLAKEHNKPPPIIGYVEGKGVTYVTSSTSKPRHFTQDDVSSRFRTRVTRLPTKR